MIYQSIDQALEDYLAPVYIMSHSHSTRSSYKLSIVNKNKSGFRDFLQQKYEFNEFQLVEKVKSEELDIYNGTVRKYYPDYLIL